MGEDIYHLGVKALAVSAQGKVLLLKVNPERLKGSGNKDYWDLPGGRVQQGSTVAETLQREVLEEVGIAHITVVRQVGMVLSNIRIPIGDAATVGLILSVYACSLPEDAAIELSDEHIEFRWFSSEEAARLLAVKYPENFCNSIAALQKTL